MPTPRSLNGVERGGRLLERLTCMGFGERALPGENRLLNAIYREVNAGWMRLYAKVDFETLPIYMAKYGQRRYARMMNTHNCMNIRFMQNMPAWDQAPKTSYQE